MLPRASDEPLDLARTSGIRVRFVMAIALPLFVDRAPVGTCFIVAARAPIVAVATALHLLGPSSELQIGVPPHLGDVSTVQIYPLDRTQVWSAKLLLAEPLLDLAILAAAMPGVTVPTPRFVAKADEVRIGETVAVLGYPFAPTGSVLETYEPCTVSALGARVVPGAPASLATRELMIVHHTHPGSSGSPVVRLSDNAVCGMVRGCLAPPGVLSIGGMPVGSDTSVTYAISAHVVPRLVERAFETMEN